MDLYFQAAAVCLAGAALAYLIYVMMTPAQMFAPMIEATNDKIQARLDNAVNLDISSFNNNTSVPGTAILPLIQDASTNELAVLIQTRAAKGLVVNYGPQLRSPQGKTLALGSFGHTGIGSESEFEKQFVTTVANLFESPQGTGGSAMGNAAYFSSDAATVYPKLADNATTPIGVSVATGLPSTNDPILNFWDPFVETYADAQLKGRTYSATGYLFTPDILRTNMPKNDNRSYALTGGNVYYINPGSSFYTTYILDSTQNIVGLYIEEHGCDTKAGILAEAMKACGYLTETFN